MRRKVYFFGMLSSRRTFRDGRFLWQASVVFLVLPAMVLSQDPVPNPTPVQSQSPATAQGEIQDFVQNASVPVESAETPTTLLRQARTMVIDSMKRAPRYTCTETIERGTWNSRRETHSCDTRAEADKLASEDRLRLDVAVSQSTEIFSWHGEKQFAEGEIGDLVGYGMVGSGLFSSFLSGIFGDSGYLTRFQFTKISTVDKEELAEYEFTMPPAASHWLMRTGHAHAIVGYHGTIWIDAKTSALRHMHIAADDLPLALGTCSVEVDVLYHTIQLGENQFVIPERAETVSTGPSGLRGVTETKFLDCREFLGESTLHFDDADAPATAKAPTGPQQVIELPPGVHFAVDLDVPLDVKESWVGDPVSGRLVDNIKVGGQVLAARGARVTGRLVALQSQFRPDERLEVGFNWQQIEVGPLTQVRLRAEFVDLSTDVTAVRSSGSGRRRSGNALSNAFQGQPKAVDERPFNFLLMGSHKGVPKNLRTNWVTVPLNKEAGKGK